MKKKETFGDKMFMTTGLLIIFPALINSKEAKKNGFFKAMKNALVSIWKDEVE